MAYHIQHLLLHLIWMLTVAQARINEPPRRGVHHPKERPEEERFRPCIYSQRSPYSPTRERKQRWIGRKCLISRTGRVYGMFVLVKVILVFFIVPELKGRT